MLDDMQTQTDEAEETVTHEGATAEETQSKLDTEEKPVLGTDGKPETETAPVEPAEDFSWLNTKKYGDDRVTATKKQAQAYPEAEKRMQTAIENENLSKRQIAVLKQENELLKGGKPAQDSIDPDNVPEEISTQIKQQFGENADVPGIISTTKIITAITQPLITSNQKRDWRDLKADLQKNDKLFNQFPELIEKVELLPLEERLDESKIKNIKANFIDANLPELLEKAKLEGVNSVKAKPAGTQATETSTKSVKKEEKKIILSTEHKQYIANHGGDPEGVETYLNTKPQKKGYAVFAE